jgi:hypothetical protein
LQEQPIAADRDGRYPGQRHHAGSESVDLSGDSVLYRLLLLNARYFQQMIISRTLLDIAENLIGTHDPAEFKSGIRVSRIDVWMGLLDRATECSPQAFGIIVRKRAEQIVKRLHSKAPAVSLPSTRLEAFRCDAPDEQALVLSMILSRQGKNMTESCATRMEPGCAIARVPAPSLRELLRILGGVVTRPARRLNEA